MPMSTLVALAGLQAMDQRGVDRAACRGRRDIAIDMPTRTGLAALRAGECS